MAGSSSGRSGFLIVTPTLRIPRTEFSVTFVRSSGPGGQNVNKVCTKAVLRWAVRSSATLPETVRARLLAKHRRRLSAEGDLLVTSQRYRDAPRNLADCLDKLRKMIQEAAQPVKSRRRTRPTRASIRRRLEQKHRLSQRKRGRRAGNDDL
jgi:ribosome-associated protein